MLNFEHIAVRDFCFARACNSGIFFGSSREPRRALDSLMISGVDSNLQPSSKTLQMPSLTQETYMIC